MHETKAFMVTESTNESAWGMGGELGTAGPTSPEEQRRSRIRVRVKSMRIGRLGRPEQRVIVAGFWVR